MSDVAASREVVVHIPGRPGEPPFSSTYNGRWYLGGYPMVEKRDCLPCPACGSTGLDPCANVVICADCDHWGPDQKGPEFMCDWREAIKDWNNDPLRKLTTPWDLAELEPFPAAIAPAEGG